MDVYSGVCPRPGPKPDDHAWWMAAGDTGSDSAGAGMATVSPQHSSGDSLVSEGSGVVEHGSSDHRPLDDVSGISPSSNLLLGGESGLAGGGEEERREGDVNAGKPRSGERCVEIHPSNKSQGRADDRTYAVTRVTRSSAPI